MSDISSNVKLSNPMKYTQVCKYGKDCSRVDCQFAHTPEQLKITNCNRHKQLDKSCIFFHEEFEDKDSYLSRVFGSYEPSHPLGKTRMCKYGLRCNRVGCEFAHTVTELKPAQCGFGNNCINRRCNFKHPSETDEQYKERIMSNRRRVLDRELASKGLVYRDDSSLCKKFVDGTLVPEWSVDDVVNRMAQMKYLFEYTDFQKYYGDVKDKMTFDQAEADILKNVGGYPPKWPWL